MIEVDCFLRANRPSMRQLVNGCDTRHAASSVSAA